MTLLTLMRRLVGGALIASVFVSINETTRAANINSDDGSESGWIFFGGSFVCGIFVLAYAALKEWR